jgi:hypothetical protein
MLEWGEYQTEHPAMSDKSIATVATVGIDIGKEFVPRRRARSARRIVLRQKWSSAPPDRNAETWRRPDWHQSLR